MKTGASGIALIKKYEGLRLEAYKCPANVWTIGYGHTGEDVFKDKVITNEQATDLLVKDLTKFEDSINSLNLPVNQNQFDSLVSITYNIGFGNLKISTLLRKVKVNPFDKTITDEFLRWNKARVNGVLTKLPGLTKRRLEESKLYFKI